MRFYFLFLSFTLFVGTAFAQGQFNLVKDVNPGPAHSDARDLYVVGEDVYFIAITSSGTGKLFITQGEANDAVELLEFTVPLVLGAALDFHVSLNGKVYFTVDETTFSEIIYVTDGTPSGTMPLPRPEEDDFRGLQYFFELNNELFFMNYEQDLELWKTDGTANGTVLVRNFCTFAGNGTCYAQSHNNNTITILNGEAYLFIKTPEYGQELWLTDGTTSGTRVIDLISGPGDHIFDYQRSIAFNDKVFFQSSNGNSNANSPSNTGDEPHVTDGTLANTSLWIDINPTSGNNYFNLHSRMHNPYTDGNKLYFFAIDGVTGDELYISDGTVGGTSSIGDIFPGNVERGRIPDFYSFNSQVLFNYSDGYFDQPNDVKITQLYTSDGTVGGTSVLKEFNSVYSPFDPKIEFNGELFFESRTLDDGREIWKTNGSESGTVLLKEINPGNGHAISALMPIVELRGLLYFIADDGNGNALWQSDGTEAGTHKADLPSGDVINAIVGDEIVETNGRLFFVADINNSGREIWSYQPGTLTSIFADANQVKVQIYPNPSSAQIIVSIDQYDGFIFDLKLFSLDGSLVSEVLSQHRSSSQLQIENLPSGMYFLNMYEKGASAVLGSWKLVVE